MQMIFYQRLFDLQKLSIPVMTVLIDSTGMQHEDYANLICGYFIVQEVCLSLKSCNIVRLFLKDNWNSYWKATTPPFG